MPFCPQRPSFRLARFRPDATRGILGDTLVVVNGITPVLAGEFVVGDFLIALSDNPLGASS
jgi:hypothetical protein